jgi:glutathione S-transferase
MYHIPVCPFSGRLEVLLESKGMSDAVEFRLVDITKPRAAELLVKSGGTTALPILELPGGLVIKESLVILRLLDETVGRTGASATPGTAAAAAAAAGKLSACGLVRRASAAEHAVEEMLNAQASAVIGCGYQWVMNRDTAKTDEFRAKLLKLYAGVGAFLRRYATGEGPLLFNDRGGALGLAEVVFTPILVRFQFLDYYEKFALPAAADAGADADDLARFAVWRAACLAAPAAQQASREEVCWRGVVIVCVLKGALRAASSR